ncbi:MAG: NADH-quinone oxidoreductase subunit NuoK [Planctomycetota bacterium]
MIDLLKNGGNEPAPYLVLAALLFSLGIFALITRRNAIGLLLGVELILNAASLNFITFTRFRGGPLDGHVISLFIILLAAAEAVVALALFFAIYHVRRTAAPDDLDEMRH